MLTWVGAGVDRLAWDVMAVVVVEVDFVGEEFEVPPVVEVDEPEGTPVGEVDEPEDIPVVEVDEPEDTPVVEVDRPEVTPVVEVDRPEVTPVVVELSAGGVVIGEPLPRVELAMQYHSLGFKLAQLMPVFQAERLAAGTPIIEFRSSQLLFYAQCQRSQDSYFISPCLILSALQRTHNAIRKV